MLQQHPRHAHHARHGWADSPTVCETLLAGLTAHLPSCHGAGPSGGPAQATHEPAANTAAVSRILGVLTLAQMFSHVAALSTHCLQRHGQQTRCVKRTPLDHRNSAEHPGPAWHVLSPTPSCLPKETIDGVHLKQTQRCDRRLQLTATTVSVCAMGYGATALPTVTLS
jgi:hypothetical protein